MSSILDALRKVEAEKTQKKKVDLGEIEEMLAEQDLVVPEEEGRQRKRVNKEQVTLVLAFVGVVALSAVIGSFLYVASHRARTGQVSQNEAGVQMPAPPIQPAIPIPEERAAVQVPQEPAKPLHPPADRPATAPVSEARKETVPTPAPTPAPPAATANAPTQPSAKPEQPAIASPKEPAQRPVLKINILRAPSEEFPDPLAVVNKKKVRVGDSVDGAKVIKIQGDGIVFEFGNEIFLVQF
jgi:hypothetical protein